MAKKIPVLTRQRIVDELLRDTFRLYDKLKEHKYREYGRIIQFGAFFVNL